MSNAMSNKMMPTIMHIMDLKAPAPGTLMKRCKLGKKMEAIPKNRRNKPVMRNIMPIILI